MRKSLFACGFVLVVLAGPSFAASKAQEDLRNTIQKIARAWESMDVRQVDPYYAEDPGLAFFDVAPLKYSGWQDYRAGVQKFVFEPNRSLKLALNDDLAIHPRGNFAWATVTYRADLESKTGERSRLDGRWTILLERRGGRWLVVHDHVSVPLAGPPSMEEQMASYLEQYASPGEHHRHLQQLAGEWTSRARFWFAPGGPADESTGRAHNEMILGGRYLETRYEGVTGGMPFSGRGLGAYDRFLGKYVETWVDTMGTMILASEGSCDGTGKVRTLLSNFVDPMTGKPTTMRWVYRVLDPDRYMLELYSRSGESSEWKVGEIEFTRAK